MVGVFFLKHVSMASKSGSYFAYLFVKFFGDDKENTLHRVFSHPPSHLCIRTLLAYHRYSREINRHLEIRAGVRVKKVLGMS